MNGFVQISTSTASIDSGLYYVGLSAATGQGYFQQNFDNWSFKATPVQYTVLHHPQPSDVGIGSTSQIYPVYQITNGSEQAGAVYTTVGDVSYRFVSEFAWIGQNCSKNGRPSVGYVKTTWPKKAKLPNLETFVDSPTISHRHPLQMCKCKALHPILWASATLRTCAWPDMMPKQALFTFATGMCRLSLIWVSNIDFG